MNRREEQKSTIFGALHRKCEHKKGFFCRAASHGNCRIGNVPLFSQTCAAPLHPPGGVHVSLAVSEAGHRGQALVATQHCVPYLDRDSCVESGQCRHLHCSTRHNITIKQLPCLSCTTARCPDCCSNTVLQGVQQTAACADQFTAACVCGMGWRLVSVATNKY